MSESFKRPALKTAYPVFCTAFTGKFTPITFWCAVRGSYLVAFGACQLPPDVKLISFTQ